MAQSLIKKLQVKSGHRMIVVNAPADFPLSRGDLPDGVNFVQRLSGEFDFILFCAKDRSDVNKFGAKVINAAKADAVLWTAYPKAGSRIKTDIHRDKGWDLFKDAGLRVVTNIALDERWSALRWRPSANVKKPGHYVSDELEAKWVNREKKLVKLPPDFAKALGTKTSGQPARAHYEQLSYSHKREYILWIVQAKKPETRANRIKKAAEILGQGPRGFNG